ncbi:NADH:ubiquinone reductase (Na(+)-transporting) subunit B [bacterium]|jgi:Na+-transporting NADH:ubiquinone oxidoreductase subunit B|nr:NADH:ubiquinone reductase (Na(+)-transporting) subunit B [bacterium]MBT4927271.1 NADH:ubiquinone reductase (Na(+)-transporting) subunit B [bacterium]MBT5734417.1 NADH:ubiquinone reductase (Na(+)-transporting) subunit B [bacterium]MBT6017696.1 NADH:ubiquinone reductase (Na(+)-transporting) subunit B [bacterium]
MKWLLDYLLKIKPNFDEGQKLNWLYPLYEATETILFSTDAKTKSAPHIRDSIDIKRVMILVVVALIPCYVFGAINVGYQNALSFGLERTWIENLIFGANAIIPIIVVTFVAGAFWEILFAIVRKHEISEGFLVTCALIPLTMPPSIPLWQLFIATSFGIVIGKEIFGGVGMNIFNPALTARCFIFFSYPSKISGDMVWLIGPDGYSGATALSVPASTNNADAVYLLNGITQFDYSWINLASGWIPGSIGETNKFIIFSAAAALMLMKLISWRVILGGISGLFAMSYIGTLIAPFSDNSMLSIPPHYHLVMGSFAFGLTFMATEPVTGSHTDTGRLVYGFFVGVLTVIIRSINPAYPEGVMLAILLMNAFASLIDYFVVKVNISKRMARYA